MTLGKLLVLTAAVDVSHAFMAHGSPLSTDHVALNPFDVSPQPTPTPYVNVHARNELHRRDWTDTCALVNGEPLTCDTPLVCVYNTQLSFMACCSTDSNGVLLDPCIMRTACVNQAQSQSICSVTANCLGPATGIWYVDFSHLTDQDEGDDEIGIMITDSPAGIYSGDPDFNPQYGACMTIILYAGPYTYTTLRCNTASAILIASPILTTSTSSSTTTPSKSTTSATTPTTTPTTKSTTTPTTRSTIISTVVSIMTVTSVSSQSKPLISSSSTSPSLSASSSSSNSPDTGNASTTVQSSTSHTAAIAGGTVGGVAGLALVVGAIAFIVHRIRVKRREARDDAPEMAGSPYLSK